MKKRNLFKRILILCLVSVLCFNSLKPKALNDAFPTLDLYNYEYLVVAHSIGLSNGVYRGYCTIIAEIVDNELIYYEDNYNPDFTITEDDLNAGPTETYGATIIENDKFYLVNNVSGQITYIQSTMATELNTFLNYQINSLTELNYHNGYNSGLDTTGEKAFTEGYNQGYNNSVIDNQKLLNEKDAYYNNIINQLNETINDLNNIINEDNMSFWNFKNFLGTLFMFPVKFFTEGLNINILGINIGYFIFGLALIGITLVIIKIVKGGKS